MLIETISLSKSIGTKVLFQNVSFSINKGEKIALIGRNGHGKTTLLKILSGEDHNFEGKVVVAKGTSITLTKQEHTDNLNQSALDYILRSVPHYYEYKQIIEDFESGANTNLGHYLETLEYCNENKHFHIADAILNTLTDFGVPENSVKGPIANLSGGQKRYVEMTRMMYSQADLLLIDEPTNHMDYQGKDRFIAWMRSLPQAVIVVTHDRDVLRYVHKIMELKDQKITVFKGNYDHFIAQNANNTLSAVKLYSDQLNRLKEAKKRVDWGLRMRAKSKDWKIRYDHWLRDYEKIKAETVKPSFWIDQNTIDSFDQKVTNSYHKFKEKNVKITAKTKSTKGMQLLRINKLSLGFDKPVFENLSFSMNDTDRLFIKGRNGAGKSTLVRTILSLSKNEEPTANNFAGEINPGNGIKIGEYEQEIDQKYLDLPLETAVRMSFDEKKISVDEGKIKSLLAQYLFDPKYYGQQKIVNLSGGQKARFQLIKMFIGEPNLLILDEPTNHLDLPSIEELEKSLSEFEGGILYISHDTYFIKRMGGKAVEL